MNHAPHPRDRVSHNVIISLNDWCLTSLWQSPSDTSDLCSIKECTQQVSALVGSEGLNLLVNNAGILIKTTLLDTTCEDMQKVFNTNVLGPMNMIKVSNSAAYNLKHFIISKMKEMTNFPPDDHL